MTVLVFGGSGQLGRTLRSELPDARFLDRSDCDLEDVATVRSIIDDVSPGIIVNAAAYTAVDRAESEPEKAQAVNAEAIQPMAAFAKESGGWLIHISTDFVFNGEKKTPYLPGDPTHPLGQYGASKLKGEQVALTTAPESTMIVRTSWLYSEHGNNFVKTMLRLMAGEQSLRVVDDQRGSPTYAGSLAALVRDIISHRSFNPGIYHWADQGQVSWYEFAVEIQQQAVARGLLKHAVPVEPIGTDDYPTAAIRPPYSVLNTDKIQQLTGLDPDPWQDNLAQMLANLS